MRKTGTVHISYLHHYIWNIIRIAAPRVANHIRPPSAGLVPSARNRSPTVHSPQLDQRDAHGSTATSAGRLVMLEGVAGVRGIISREPSG